MTQSALKATIENNFNDAPGTIAGKGHLRIERLLPGPIENVWSYITDKDKCAKWLASFKSEQKVGCSISLGFDHDSLSSETIISDKKRLRRRNRQNHKI